MSRNHARNIRRFIELAHHIGKHPASLGASRLGKRAIRFAQSLADESKVASRFQQDPVEVAKFGMLRFLHGIDLHCDKTKATNDE
jgi:hypothetical protein